MQNFDVVIIGAGPAGCQCARSLAGLGYHVLLVEQHKDFLQNNFSSAATPMVTLEQFALPDAVVGSYWQKLAIITTAAECNWQSSRPVGAVLDFAKLRQFLAHTIEVNGGVIWMSHRYISHTHVAGKTAVLIKSKEGDIITIGTRILVDATGFSRAVIYSDKKDKPAFLRAKGIEYLLEVSDKVYQDYANTLLFFMGHKWSPKGYAWIFPMADNQLKVGAACYDETHKLIQQIKPLKKYIHSIIEDYMRLERYKVIDRHGSILEYSPGLNDIFQFSDTKSPNCPSPKSSASMLGVFDGNIFAPLVQPSGCFQLTSCQDVMLPLKITTAIGRMKIWAPATPGT